MNIEQGSCFLTDLTRQVLTGSLLPASFQRPYVWTKADVLALMGSIMKGYPVGSFLLWTPWGKDPLDKVSRGRIGPVAGDAQARVTSLLLDGQNRLASFAWLSYDFSQILPFDLYGQEKLTWGDGSELVLDLITREFKFVPHSEANLGLRVPSRVVTDRTLSNPYVRQAWSTSWADFDEKTKDIAMCTLDDALNALSDARVSVTDIQGATAEEAKDAFKHICRVGVPMSDADFDAAMAWTIQT